MRFHVVPLTDEQQKQLPPVSSVLLNRTSHLLLTLRKPTILFFDVTAGKFPGYDHNTVYLLNDAAWEACQGVGLNSVSVIEHSELPKKFGLLIGSQGVFQGKFD